MLLNFILYNLYQLLSKQYNKILINACTAFSLYFPGSCFAGTGFSFIAKMSSETERHKRKTRAPTDPERQKRNTPAPSAGLKRPKSEQTESAETVREERHDLDQVQAAEAEARGLQLCKGGCDRATYSAGVKPGVSQDAPWRDYLLRGTDLKAAVSDLATTVLAEGWEIHKKQDLKGARSGACGKSIAASQQPRMIEALVSLDSGFLNYTFAQVPGLAEKERERVAARVAARKVEGDMNPITLTSAKLGDRRLCDIVADYLRSRTVKQFVSTMHNLTGDFDCC